MEVIQIILEGAENNVLKLYGHVVSMEDNRWPKRITWRTEGRRQRGQHEAKWDKEVVRFMKQNI